jgi:hypothetical protein
VTRRLSLAEQLAAQLRDATLAEIVRASAWDCHVVMQVVLLYGQNHDRWTCNGIRDLVPEQGKGYLGAAINGMNRAGIIARVPVDGVPSTSEKTHGHRLAVWSLTARGHRIAAGRFHLEAEAAA